MPGPEVETIFVLLPLALLIAVIAVGFFVWAARTGQFDDLDTPAVRILFDEDLAVGSLKSEVRSPSQESESEVRSQQSQPEVVSLGEESNAR